MVDYNSTIKKHIHGSVAKLWSNNEQGILWILIMPFMGSPEPQLFELIFEIQHFNLKFFPLFRPFFSFSLQYISTW
jgi:hypothetical protein